MKYRIEIDKPARKFIEKQTPTQQRRLLNAIYKLPTAGDIKPLRGQSNAYRLRVGYYRVIYSVREDALLVLVMTVGNRGDVY